MMNALILATDSALRTLFAEPRASRPNPAASVTDLVLNDAERRQSGALMRINHVGCLLYTSPSPRDRQKSRMPSSA